MKNTARILSLLFHPYLMPLYGGIFIVSYSFLSILPFSVLLLIIGGIFLFSGIFPTLFHIALSLFYVKSEKKAYIRKTEILLYTVFLVFAAIYLNRLHLPLWGQSYLVGAALANAIVWITNMLGWRISFYMCNLGALLGLAITMLLTNNPFPLGALTLVILATGIVGTARQLLGYNSLAQITLGWLNGLLCTLLLSTVFRYSMFIFT